jgi:osmoprotectant transport system substrate-binding protein
MFKLTRRRALALALTSTMVVAACGGDDGDTGSTAGGDPVSIRVGSANFPENELLMEIYAQALDSIGVDATTQPNIGSREVYYQSIVDGDIQLLPEYTNSLLSFVSRQEGGTAEATTTEEQITELGEKLPENLQVLAPSEAQDKDTISCNQETVDEYGLTDFSSLAPVSGEIVFGGPPEFAERSPFGVPGLREAYGIEFAEFVPLDVAGPLTVEALASNEVNCANLFSTQSAIVANDFVVLEDDQNLVPAENVVPLIASDVATDAVVEKLDAVSAALDTENLTALVARVEVDQESAADVAASFLEENDLLG